MIHFVKKWLFPLLGALLLLWFFITIDMARFFDEIINVDLRLVFLGIAMYFISISFRTLRWKLLLSGVKVVPHNQLYPVVVVGYMANNILPFRLGEFVRSYYLYKRTGIGVTRGITAIFVERIFDALVLLLFIAVIGLFVPIYKNLTSLGEAYNISLVQLIILFSFPFLLAFAFVMFSSFYPQFVLALLKKIVKILKSSISAWIFKKFDVIVKGFRILSSPLIFIRVFALSIAVWSFEAVLFIFIGMSFQIDHLYTNMFYFLITMVLAMSIGNIASSIPFAPGGIGLFEVVTREVVVLFSFMMIDRTVASAYVTVVHIALLLPMIVGGQIFLITDQITFKKLLDNSKQG